MNRRIFLRNTSILFAAPAIVKAENIMKIAKPKETSLIVNTGFCASSREYDVLIMRAIANALNVPYYLLCKHYRTASFSTDKGLI